jgi:hypothetical protein
LGRCGALAETRIEVHPPALGESEVEEARSPSLVVVEIDDHVGWLQIAVHDSARVRV